MSLGERMKTGERVASAVWLWNAVTFQTLETNGSNILTSWRVSGRRPMLLKCRNWSCWCEICCVQTHLSCFLVSESRVGSVLADVISRWGVPSANQMSSCSARSLEETHLLTITSCWEKQLRSFVWSNFINTICFRQKECSQQIQLINNDELIRTD